MLLDGTTLRSFAKSLIQSFFQVSVITQVMPQYFLDFGGLPWFLSAAMFAGSICVFLRTAYGKQSNFIFFIGAVGIYNYLINTFGNLDVWMKPALFGTSSGGLCRGLAGVMLGHVIRDLFDRLDKIRLNKAGIAASRFILFFGVLGVGAAASIKLDARLTGMKDCMFVVIFCILICCASYHSNVFRSAWTDYIDRLCLPVYLFQYAALPIGYLVSMGAGGYVAALTLDIAISALWAEITRRASHRKTGNGG